jgi:hypothetical protein
MSDTDKIMASYKNHQKARAEANAITKTALFDALAAAEITRVAVTFDGEGDSGQIGEITAYKNDDECPLPVAEVEIQQVSWDGGKLDSTKSPLRDAIEALCYDYLSQEHDGWENNDGAFGEFEFDVAERTIELECNVRFSDATLFSHSF